MGRPKQPIGDWWLERQIQDERRHLETLRNYGKREGLVVAWPTYQSKPSHPMPCLFYSHPYSSSTSSPSLLDSRLSENAFSLAEIASIISFRCCPGGQRLT